MSKNDKFPYEKFTKVAEGQIDVSIDGGDLWLRKNIDPLDDLKFAIDHLYVAVQEYKKKFNQKINKFLFDIRYIIPDLEQLNELKKKKSNSFDPRDHNYHFYLPIDYAPKLKKIFISEDLLCVADEHVWMMVTDIIKLLGNIESVYFWARGLRGEVYESLDTGADEYIEKDLGQKNWTPNFLEVKDKIDEYGNDLEILSVFRGLVDKKIKFEFNSIDKEEEQILKKNKII